MSYISTNAQHYMYEYTKVYVDTIEGGWCLRRSIAIVDGVYMLAVEWCVIHRGIVQVQ